MRRSILGLCIFAAACSNQSASSPTAPSFTDQNTLSAPIGAARPDIALATVGTQNVEVTFTKWITTFPNMSGFTGGAVPGTYAGIVLNRVPFANDVIVQLEARYEVIDPSGLHSFVTVIEGKSTKGSAVLNGVVTEGWMLGARTHVTFDAVTPCEFGPMTTCFQGTIRLISGSAEK